MQQNSKCKSLGAESKLLAREVFLKPHIACPGNHDDNDDDVDDDDVDCYDDDGDDDDVDVDDDDVDDDDGEKRGGAR